MLITDLETLPTETVLTQWRPGSEEEDWPSEFANMIQDGPTDHIAALVWDIAENGILETVVLGDDGRVWDGHHRLLVARILGLTYVPVEYGHSWAEEPPSGALSLTR